MMTEDSDNEEQQSMDVFPYQDDDIMNNNRTTVNNCNSTNKCTSTNNNNSNHEQFLYNQQKKIILSTAYDAIVTKYATVEAGYYDDPYVKVFYEQQQLQLQQQHKYSNPSHTRPRHHDVQVIIKRGTFARVTCIQNTIETFLRVATTTIATAAAATRTEKGTNHMQQQQPQIIILGCGYDTCFYRFIKKSFFHHLHMMNQQQNSSAATNHKNHNSNNDDDDEEDEHDNDDDESESESDDESDDVKNNDTTTNLIKWIEIDHTEIIREKIRMIQQYSDTLFHTQIEEIHTSSTNSTTGPDPFNSNHQQPLGKIYELKQQKQQQKEKLGTNPYHKYMMDNDDNIDSWKVACYYMEHDLQTDPKRLMQLLFQARESTSTSSSSIVQFDVPTLIIMECVQMYLPVFSNQILLQQFVQQFHQNQNCFLCCYEPILLSKQDLFGQMMEKNLTKLGIIQQQRQSKQQSKQHSKTATTTTTRNAGDTNDDNKKNDSTTMTTTMLTYCRTVQDYIQYLQTNCHFVTITGCDMYQAYETIVTSNQRQKANQCEFLDEMEEFYLIMKHYCYIFASSSTSLLSSSSEEEDDDATTTTTNNICQSITQQLCIPMMPVTCPTNTRLPVLPLKPSVVPVGTTVTTTPQLPTTTNRNTRSTGRRVIHSLGFVQNKCETTVPLH